MAMLDNSNNTGFMPNSTLGSNNPMANLAVGGWDGLTPGTGVVGPDGNYYSLLVANQPYVKRPLIFLMLTYPKGFDFYGETKRAELIKIYKNLLERRASSIEGLNNALTVEMGETPISGTNESYKTILNVTKEASNISFTFNEKDGKPIYRWHEWFITDLMMHYSSKVPEVTKLSTYSNTKSYGADMYSFTGLAIEPDVSNRYVVDAYLGENIFPGGTGESTANKNRAEAGTNVDVTIEYGGYWDSSPQVRKFAQEMLNMLVATYKRYENEPMFLNAIDPSVAASTGGIDF